VTRPLPRDAPDAEGLPQPRRGFSAACIAAGIAVTVLDAAMVNVALPYAARDLGLSASEAVWVVNAYQITVVGALIPMASLGEILGFRRVWAVGLAVFILGALLAALAPSFAALLGARVLQGLGSAAVMGLTAGLVRHTYPLAQLGRAIGVNAMTVAACSAAGPSVGAAVLSALPWQSVFAAHIPIGLTALLFGLRLLPPPRPQPRAFDWASAALNLGGFGLVFVGADLLLHAPALGLTALLAGIVTLFALAQREFARSVPLLPLDLIAIPRVRLAVLASVCIFAAHMASSISLPFHLAAAGYSAAQIGLILTAYPLSLGALAPLAGRWADRGDSAWPCIAGGVLLAFAAILLSQLPAAGPLWPIVAALILAGCGFGLFQAPNNRTMLAAAPRARAGSAGGMQATARVLGQSIGATAAAACFALAGPWAGFLVGSALALLAAGFSLARR
jgi:DHA2 family multidrug resistance protein-like MFS transporter